MTGHSRGALPKATHNRRQRSSGVLVVSAQLDADNDRRDRIQRDHCAKEFMGPQRARLFDKVARKPLLISCFEPKTKDLE